MKRGGLFFLAATALSLFAAQPCAAISGTNALSGLKEDKLEKQPTGAKARIYRMIIEPAWGYVFCLRVQTDSQGGYLVMKRLSGATFRDQGVVAERTVTRLTTEELEQFESLVSGAGLASAPEDDSYHGKDGADWTFEISKAGVYRNLVRWEPQDRDSCAGFVKAFKWAADKAGVTSRIKNKTSLLIPN